MFYNINKEEEAQANSDATAHIIYLKTGQPRPN